MFGKGKPPPSGRLADRMRKAVERSIAPDPAFPQHTRTDRPARQAVYRQGTLVLAEGERLSVAIKDLSEGGARVEYFIRRDLPDFVVLIETTLRIRRQARVVWQLLRQIADCSAATTRPNAILHAPPNSARLTP